MLVDGLVWFSSVSVEVYIVSYGITKPSRWNITLMYKNGLMYYRFSKILHARIIFTSIYGNNKCNICQ